MGHEAMIIGSVIITVIVVPAMYFFVKWAESSQPQRPRNKCSECDRRSYEYDGWW